jgi:hypothetical protein
MKTIESRIKGVLVSLLLPVGVFADGSDDFNDNKKDTAKWGNDVAGGLGVLTEKNQRLEFTCNNPLSDGDTWRPWILERFPVDGNWTVQIDTYNNTAPSTIGQVTSGGFTLFHPATPNSELYVELYAAPFGAPVNKGFDANLLTYDATVGNADTGVVAGNEAVRGAVRLVYDGTSKVATAYYDTDTSDGYQWTELASYGLAGAGGTTANTDWGLSASQQFTVYVYGYSAGMTVSSGQLFLDNFAETGGVPSSGGTAPVPTGKFSFGFPTNNPLLVAIANITGSYIGTTTIAPYRGYAVDAAQDESGKVVAMGSVAGITTPTGGTEISGGAGTVKTVNDRPTCVMKGSFEVNRDGTPATLKGTFSGPLEVVDIGGGSNGVAMDVNFSAKANGVPFTFRETGTMVPVNDSQIANLRKNWTLELDINQKTVNGKPVTVATASLTLPNGDTVSFPEKKVKYSSTKGYNLSFSKGTITTVMPNRPDKKSKIKITGLTFAKPDTEWQPTGGTINYSFLGQKGTAKLMDFLSP